MFSSLASRTLRSAVKAAPRRCLNIHEYDSYQVLNSYGVDTPKGLIAYTPKEVEEAVESLGKSKAVVKAQVLAGGRGMGSFDNGFTGGVHMVNSPAEGASLASKMLGAKLITKQTGGGGLPCAKLMVAEPISIEKEFYLAFVLDRKAGGLAIIGSSEGGMNIEETAVKKPDAIKKVAVDILKGLSADQARELAAGLGLPESLHDQAVDQFLKLYDCMIKSDATQIEINPLVTTTDGRLLCADAKLNFDDNAEFRQAELFRRRDTTQEDQRDVEAQKHDLSYVGLDGSIGCLVNGAGLAMSTMDIIKLNKGEPANFLDVGGSADTKTITAAFQIITADPAVHAIFVNIFGGIMSCRTIAAGIMAALEEVEVKIPLVVRLQGTHEKEGSQILGQYTGDTPIIAINDLDNAAKCVTYLAQFSGAAAGKN